ncbi:MAG: DUF3142 domain-containing protein [Acidobacteria bacterium]|nr:DUF3142 domain-containing protein [Acidobacteriota bacterium]
MRRWGSGDKPFRELCWLGIAVIRGLLRFGGLLCLLAPALVQAPTGGWTTGFWFWQGSSAAMGAGMGPVDVLYVQAGTIRHDDGPSGRWIVWAKWPDEALPPAREYWAVLRAETRTAPPLDLAKQVAGAVAGLTVERRRNALGLAGVQLDIDCPTGSLAQYAAFLAEFRKGLPAGMQVSITGLLDWFRSGTAVGEVVEQVDEFVPQFYDLGEARWNEERPAIAARVDAGRWGPVFNRYRKRFRVGISSFGRASYWRRDTRRPYGLSGVTPMDLASNRAFTRTAARNDAGEAVLTFEARMDVTIVWESIHAGDRVEYVIPSREHLHNAVEQARRMGEYCRGVLFFRWPAFNEATAAMPKDALQAAGAGVRPEPPAVRAIDGECAAVHCVDLYLLHADSLSPRPLRYRIAVSEELEYIVPRERAPVRMSGPSEIEVALPAYSGINRMYLGRAVTLKPARYRVAP